jgi:hypothetical protein
VIVWNSKTASLRVGLMYLALTCLFWIIWNIICVLRKACCSLLVIPLPGLCTFRLFLDPHTCYQGFPGLVSELLNIYLVRRFTLWNLLLVGLFLNGKLMFSLTCKCCKK